MVGYSTFLLVCEYYVLMIFLYEICILSIIKQYHSLNMVINDNPRTKQFLGDFRGGGSYIGLQEGRQKNLAPALGSVSMSFFRNGVIIALPNTVPS